MKKWLFTILALFLSAHVMAAATATPTLTFTLTPTPTSTWTETPIAVLRPDLMRTYHNPSAVRMSDGITAPATTPTPGGVWLAQTNNEPYFVMGTGTAGSEPLVRMRWKVPANYQKPGAGGQYAQVWLEDAWNSSATNTVQLAVNVFVVKRNANFSNAPQKQSFLGVTTNVQTLPFSYALSQITSTARDVKLAMPAGISQVAASDDVTFEIVRSGTSGNLSVGGVRVEYNPVNFKNP